MNEKHRWWTQRELTKERRRQEKKDLRNGGRIYVWTRL